jgi:hypothetical protein
MRRRRARARPAADMRFIALAGGCLTPRPSREFAPAGDLLSCADKKVGKETGPVPSPLRCATGSPAMLGARGPRRTPFATLRSDSCAESVDEARCARASGSCASRLLQRGAPEQPTARNQQPSPQAGWRRLFIHPPFEPAEERRTLRPRAQLASRTDSAQLFDRSVAEGVLRGASRSEHRRAARCEAKGRAVRGRLFAFFLVAQKEDRPPGRHPGMGLASNTNLSEASQCL